MAYCVLAVGQIICKVHQNTNTSAKTCCDLTIQFTGVVLLVDVCMGRAFLSLGLGIHPKQRTQLHHMLVVGLHCQASIRLQAVDPFEKSNFVPRFLDVLH